MSYINIILTLIFIAVAMVAFLLSGCMDILRSLYQQLKPSEGVVLDVDAKWEAKTLADVLLRKIRDLERQQFALKDILEKLEEMQGFQELAPLQKQEIYAAKGILSKVKAKNSMEQ